MKKAILLSVLISMFVLTAVTLSAKASASPVEIFINPNPMDKWTTITLNFIQEATIGVNVETEQGIVIKTLYWGPVNGQMTLTWNRLADDGTPVPSGNYVLVVNHQGRYTSTKKTLILK